MSAELLAPAGDFKTALAAFAAGADAVYCGLTDFSARAFAANFSYEDLANLRRLGKKVYVTFNTVLDEANLEDALERLSRLDAIRPDALIVQDLGVARLCRRHFPGLALHASTQLVAHNLEGVLALGELGFTRVVLARELSLDEIRQIRARCGDLELEVFVHGALCYSVSGLCLYGAMEKGRSGNRGKCPYCCRQMIDGRYPFSMKDLRLGEDVLRLVDAGVASLKIEGRMKSSLYVASVVKWYRDILDRAKATVSSADLETVFSRRTTELRFDGSGRDSPIDPDSLGHLGTPVGVVKRITRDREGRSWLRFHTLRALEKHDGLQFEALTDDGRHFGFGIAEMRKALSRAPVFEVAAGEDVEVAVPEDAPVRDGDTVYCSMSNAVKRRFPEISFRRADHPGCLPLKLELEFSERRVVARAGGVEAALDGEFAAAKSPEKTLPSVEKAFSRFGDTDYRLDSLDLADPARRYVPMSVLNELRRQLVGKLDAEREEIRRRRLDDALDALAELPAVGSGEYAELRVLRLRPDQPIPPGEWDEVVYVIGPDVRELPDAGGAVVRLALPVWNGELDFNRLRVRVKGLVRDGFDKWECADLATLRLLKSCGIKDITADWTLYAFNSAALAALAELGVKRFVASPENGADNLAFLAESGYAVEFLVQQSTPLFISLHEPAGDVGAAKLAVVRRGGLFVTVARQPRTFSPPPSARIRRVDLSWDPS